MRQLEVDHLHNHFANSSCTVAMLAAHVAAVPFSFTMHGPAIFFEPHRWRIDEKMRRARFVACISMYCRSQAMIFAQPAAWPRLHVIHCGVEPQCYLTVRHTEPGSRLLFVGRLARVKGLAVLLEAMRAIVQRCANVRLTLVGDGEERSILEQQVREMGLAAHVQFVGYRSSDEVGELLRQTDVFVLPSFAEGVPVVLMEAMATGLPVVATRIAGVAELVTDGVSGHLVAPGDAPSLADRVAELLDDAALRQRMGEAGRATVEQSFNVSTETKRLHELFMGAGSMGVVASEAPAPTTTCAAPPPKPTA
ncbi:MAG: glycosyltransferase family 4 protein [Phycisphaeraceae bacterium]